MPVLSDLEPREVFFWFERLCAIPHGSHHTKAISDYLVAFARERGLACRDAANNVVIRKAASAGYENAPVVMLQGHIDMVCEKDADCGKDMETEGLDLFVDGDTIGARGHNARRGRRHCRRDGARRPDADDIPTARWSVFTADEEVGMMIGARALDASDLKAKVPHQHRLGGGGGGGGGRPHGQLRRRLPHGVPRCPPVFDGQMLASGSKQAFAGHPARRSTGRKSTPIFCSAARSTK